jgi:hypothetical protein
MLGQTVVSVSLILPREEIHLFLGIMVESRRRPSLMTPISERAEQLQNARTKKKEIAVSQYALFINAV